MKIERFIRGREIKYKKECRQKVDIFLKKYEKWLERKLEVDVATERSKFSCTHQK